MRPTLVLALILPLGCGSSSSDKADKAATDKPTRPAPKLEIDPLAAQQLTLTGDAGLRGAIVFEVAPDGLHIVAKGVPNGTQIMSEGKSVTTGQGASELTLSLDARIAALPWSHFQAEDTRVVLGIQFSVAVPGYETVHARAPRLGLPLGKTFRTMASTGAMWPGESGPAEITPPAVAWALGDSLHALGEAARVGDVRFVAVGQRKLNENKTVRCMYSGGTELEVGTIEVDVRIVDRFTKQTIAERTFSGTPECSKEIAVREGEGPGGVHTGALGAGPNLETMFAWAVKQVRARAKR